jgi:hypothetical protein
MPLKPWDKWRIIDSSRISRSFNDAAFHRSEPHRLFGNDRAEFNATQSIHSLFCLMIGIAFSMIRSGIGHRFKVERAYSTEKVGFYQLRAFSDTVAGNTRFQG